MGQAGSHSDGSVTPAPIAPNAIYFIAKEAIGKAVGLNCSVAKTLALVGKNASAHAKSGSAVFTACRFHFDSCSRLLHKRKSPFFLETQAGALVRIRWSNALSAAVAPAPAAMMICL